MCWVISVTGGQQERGRAGLGPNAQRGGAPRGRVHRRLLRPPSHLLRPTPSRPAPPEQPPHQAVPGLDRQSPPARRVGQMTVLGCARPPVCATPAFRPATPAPVIKASPPAKIPGLKSLVPDAPISVAPLPPAPSAPPPPPIAAAPATVISAAPPAPIATAASQPQSRPRTLGTVVQLQKSNIAARITEREAADARRQSRARWHLAAASRTRAKPLLVSPIPPAVCPTPFVPFAWAGLPLSFALLRLRALRRCRQAALL